jgi:hypothetical protein
VATRELLLAYGVSLVPEHVVADAEEALAVARVLGTPVVLKTTAAGAHKTESGGVALNLETDDEIRAAAERIGGPLLVQPMISGGIELLAGVVQDPLFGPLVAFGPGGVLAELIGGWCKAAKPAGSSAASAAHPRLTQARSSRSSSDCPSSHSTYRKSRSWISIRSSGVRTVASWWTREFGSRPGPRIAP